jgi:hypothetical protein
LRDTISNLRSGNTFASCSKTIVVCFMANWVM